MSAATTEKNKIPKGCIPISILIVVFITFFLIRSKIEGEQSTEQRTKYAKEWHSGLTDEQQRRWIEDELNQGNENADISMAKAIKSQFNYPEEVDFETGNYPRFENGKIGLQDSGWVLYKGFGTAKNSFGIKSRFEYFVKLVVLPDTLFMESVRAWEVK